MSPDLIRYVKDSGFVCMSWGGLNDIPEHAKVNRPLSKFDLLPHKFLPTLQNFDDDLPLM